MPEPIEGHLVQRVPWREPLTVTERQRAVDFGMSLADALATLRRMDDATRALAEAIAVEQRLVERVPQGCRVDRSAVFVTQGKLTVDVAFSSGPEPEQLAVTERDEVVVDHPAGEVVVPIERARTEVDIVDVTWTPLGAVSSHVCPSCGEAWIYTAEPGETITLGPDTCTNPWHGRLVDDPKRTPLGSLRTW